MSQKTIRVGSIEIANDKPFVLFGGMNVLESRDLALQICETYVKVTEKLGIPYIFKASFDKANRTCVSSFRGPGLEEGLAALEAVRTALDLRVLTDVHEPWQCEAAARVADVLQVPAFLCRQTDLLTAAAATGRVVNVKKGQFLAPWDMANVVAKITGAGNTNVLVTERGASFGYNTLVSDMRALPELAKTGAPVIFDATHSVQQPGALGTKTGGDRTRVPGLARAAVATGCVDGLFFEVHPDPDRSPSDAANILQIETLPALLDELLAIDAVAKGR